MVADRIERDVVIDAPMERVWEVLTGPEHMPGWFGGATARVELRPGGEMVFHWTEHGTFHGSVERVDAPRAFSFRWALVADEPAREGNSTLVEFTLAPEVEGTRLRVVETGFAALAGTASSRAKHLEENREGWARALEGLRAYAPGAAADV